MRWPYPPADARGVWGDVTSTIDWCEENYVVSPYIAEWANTLTNTYFVLIALYATHVARRNELEKRFVLIGIGFTLVGIGSFLFHMTLKYHFQLLDELPMLYATAIPTWSVICDHTSKQWLAGVLLFALVTTLSSVYIVFRDPVLHQVVYAFFTMCVVVTSTISANTKVKDPTIKRNLNKCMQLGVANFALGFILWLLDKNLCWFWIHIRRSYLQLPLGLLLELHGWWHILTGTGVYLYLVYLQYLRIVIRPTPNRNSSNYRLIWRWRILPELVKTSYKINTAFSNVFRGKYQEKTS